MFEKKSSLVASATNAPFVCPYVTDSCGGRMLALLFPGITDALMSLRKLRPTRLVENMIMLPLITR